MAFSVTPTTLDAGTLAPGASVDLPVTFSDVPADVTDTAVVTLSLDGVNVGVNVTATVDNPDVVVSSIVVPQTLIDQGISVQVVGLTNAGATIRVSRAA